MAINSNNSPYKHKFELCQISNSDYYQRPSELACIQVPRIFDHVFIRDCKLLKIKINKCPLSSETGVFQGLCNVDIKSTRIKSCLDIQNKPNYKKIKLAVTVKFDIKFSTEKSCILQPSQTTFNIDLKEIYCPGIPCCSRGTRCTRSNLLLTSSCFDFDNNLMDIDASPEIVNHEIDADNNILFIEMGCFFVVTSLCVVRLIVPSYGYYPVTDEQTNPLLSSDSCFCDQKKYPFPTKLFPDSK